jgi:hypothetical protein
MNLRTGILFIGLSLGLTACATTGMNSKTGGGWLAFQTEGELATNEASASKKGEACTSNILGITFGDGSVHAAKKDGGITRVASVDTKYFKVLFIYGSACTIVRGN